MISPLLFGTLRKYRGIDVSVLGTAMAMNALSDKVGLEVLHWADFLALSRLAEIAEPA